MGTTARPASLRRAIAAYAIDGSRPSWVSVSSMSVSTARTARRASTVNSAIGRIGLNGSCRHFPLHIRVELARRLGEIEHSKPFANLAGVEKGFSVERSGNADHGGAGGSASCCQGGLHLICGT